MDNHDDGMEGTGIKWGKKQRVKWMIEGSALRIVFRNGDVRRFSRHDIPAEIQDRLTMHGLKQKLADACAENDDAAQDVAAIDALFQQLTQGEWSAQRGEGGILAEAVSMVTGQPMDAVIERLKKMDDKQKRELAKNAKVAAAMDEIRKRKNLNAKGVSDEELEGMFA